MSSIVSQGKTRSRKAWLKENNLLTGPMKSLSGDRTKTAPKCLDAFGIRKSIARILISLVKIKCTKERDTLNKKKLP